VVDRVGHAVCECVCGRPTTPSFAPRMYIPTSINTQKNTHPGAPRVALVAVVREVEAVVLEGRRGGVVQLCVFYSGNGN
jgi:hypothetical protein